MNNIRGASAQTLETEPDAEADAELIGQNASGATGRRQQRLLERHRRKVTQTAYQALGNVDDANDVAQETLMVALQTLSDLREPARFPAWLRQLTLSRCIDYRRRRGTRRLGEPITAAQRDRRGDRFCRTPGRPAVACAPVGNASRTTLLLHYVGGWSLAEIATLLRVPLNTVRSRLMAAKAPAARRSERPLFEPTAHSVLETAATSLKPLSGPTR